MESSLTIAVEGRFEEAARLSGDALYDQGAVRAHPPRDADGGRTWYAGVYEGRWWDCHIDEEGDGSLLLGCSCMRQGPVTPCAHLRAALRAIDQRAWEVRIPPPPRPDLRASAWVREHAREVPPGPVLEIACGSGRNGRLFLERGHPVTFVDIDLAGVEDLADHPSAELLEADLEIGGWPLGARRFSAVVVTCYLWRPLLPRLVAAVAPGGVLIYETFAEGNERLGRPTNPGFLLVAGELLELVRGHLTVRAYTFGEVEIPHPAQMQRICAARMEVPR